ncbi:Nuclease HARBI1 [Camponotus japonicus]
MPLDPELKLALTLSYLAHGDSRVSKHWEFRIGRSTVHKVINDTCCALVKTLQPKYLSPPTEEEWTRIVKNFFEIWQFPNCFGCIDGKHIRIKAPGNSGSKYFNYKKFFSMILLAVCDAQYRFTYVDVGQYSSISDSGIWSNCELGSALKNQNLNLPSPKELPRTIIKTNFCLIGDEIFPLLPTHTENNIY